MASNSFLLLTISLLFCLATYQVSAIKCYACTVSIGEIDQRCVDKPGSVQSGQPIVNCNYEFCTSRRVEFKDPPNKVQSMHRGCDSDPDQMNTIIEDDQFITYYRACRNDLCNGGNGKGGNGGVGFDPENGEKGVLKVKGIDDASRGAASLGLVLAVAALIIMMFD